MDNESEFKEVIKRKIKKVKERQRVKIVNRFFENETRKRISFELEKKR